MIHDPCYPGNILHTFTENTSVKRHNVSQLKTISGPLITIPGKDKIPKNSKILDIRKAQS